MSRRPKKRRKSSAVAAASSSAKSPRKGSSPRAATLATPWIAGVGALVVGLATALAFSNAAPNVAVHDDKFFVPSQFGLDFASVRRMFSMDTWSITGTWGALYRPLLLLSLAFNGATSETLRGYHVANIVLHVVTVLTLYAFLLALLRRTDLSTGGDGDPSHVHLLAAAGAALAFGVHPIHTEAVDSIFNRSEIMATLGVLSALFVIDRWEEHRPALAWTLAACAYLAALFCRESAVSLPVLAGLMLWVLHPEDDWRRLIRRLAPIAVLLIALLFYALVRQSALAGAVASTATLSENLDREAGFGYQLALGFASLREYLRMILWPFPLRASYEDFGPDNVLVSVVISVLAIGLSVVLRSRARLVTFGIGFFYLALLPSMRLVATSTLGLSLSRQLMVIAERVAYLPSVGFAIALAAGLAALGRLGTRRAVALVFALFAVFAPVTYHRNQQWRNETTLWEAETRAAPQNGDAWRLLTAAYQKEGRNQDVALICDQQSGRHRIAQLLNNCGNSYAELKRFQDAESSYRRAIELGLTAVGHANLGRVLAQQGRMVEAEAAYAQAVQAETHPARRHLRQAQLILRFHPDQLENARSELQQALTIEPGFRPALDLLRRIGSPGASG